MNWLQNIGDADILRDAISASAVFWYRARRGGMRLVIAALLTLVGYSVNDTIVVFDRVRENLKIRRRDDLSAIMNDSINQTLSRTILTSGLTFLTVLALFIFGGEIINHFAFAMVIGIIVGTYSSIAIAAPLVLVYTNVRGRMTAVQSLAPARSAGSKAPRPAKMPAKIK